MKTQQEKTPAKHTTPRAVSVSIDVAEMRQALDFYRDALGGTFKAKYTDQWQVMTIAGIDVHIQQKESGTLAAADQPRDYSRHWTPIHLDFTVDDIRGLCLAVEENGGTVEKQEFSAVADIAHCADPFGNGFCIIRE